MFDPEPLSSHLDLPRRLLSGDVEHRLFLGRQAWKRLKEQCRLPNPRITTDQNDRTGNDSATQHPIKLADTREPAIFTNHFNIGNRRRLRLRHLHRSGPPLTSRRLPFLFHGIPTAAIRAATEPSGRLVAASLAGKTRLRPHSEVPQ